MSTPIVTLNQWRSFGPEDELATAPYPFLWKAGQSRLFTPELCRELGRQCGQLPGTEPCEAGDQCTCFAAAFVEEWNQRAHQEEPAFSLSDAPSPVDVPASGTAAPSPVADTPIATDDSTTETAGEPAQE